MIRIIYITVSLLVYFPLFSQHYAGKWAMGCGACIAPNNGGSTLDFTGDTLIATAAGRGMSLRTNAGICDKKGDFLFYTNSYWVANVNDDTMQNGNGLYHTSSAMGYATHGGAAPQGAIVLPVPNDSMRYYLIHQTYSGLNGVYYPHTLIYSIIDMQQDSGRGAVTTKNMIFSQNRQFPWGQMTACKHGNGKDWWLLLPKLQSSYYYRFLITQQGISAPDSQSIPWSIPSVDSGQGVFSPDGTKYARYAWDYDGRLLIFDFDRCTGILSHKREIVVADGGGGIGGCAFSPNSRFVYVGDIIHIHQFDTEAINVASSNQIILTYDGVTDMGSSTNFGYGLLAEDKKVHFGTCGATHYLHCINQPDSTGLASQPSARLVYIPKGYERLLPNYPNYNLGAMSPTACDSIISITKQEEVISQFSIYPNPATNEVSLTLSELPKTNLALKIYNSWGALVYQGEWQENISSCKLNMQDYTNGLYFITLLDSGKIVHQAKLIISQ